MRRTRGKNVQNILLGLLSGPLLAVIVLLIPLGILTGISVVLDPSLAMYEFVPEEELLVPFLLLAILFSAANVRLAMVMSGDRNAGRVIRVTTDRYVADPSGKDNVHGHPGRAFADEFRTFLAAREVRSAAMGVVSDVSLGVPLGEDYGWGFWVGEKAFSPLWVAIAHGGRIDEESRLDEYVVAITLEPPLLPWRRLTYRPDFGLRDEIEMQLKDFLASNGMPFKVEVEDWVDPEPKSETAPRF